MEHNIPPRATFDQIMAGLGYLNKTQLRAVEAKAKFFGQHERRTGPTTIENEDWLKIGILSELTNRGLDGRDFRIKKDSSFASFNTQSENVRSILLKAVEPLTAVQCRALGGVAAECLAKYILTWRHEGKSFEVTRETMFRYASRIPQAINWAFPGYLESGLLGVLIK